MAKTSEIGTFTPAQSKMILDEVRRLMRTGYMPKSGHKNPSIPPAATPVYIKNVSGETLPAFGCCQVTGTVEDGGQNYLEVDKPADFNGDAGWFVANLFEDIAAGEFGIANDGPMVRVLGAITPTNKYNPDPGSWTTVAAADGIFIAAGPDDIDTNVGKAFIVSADGDTVPWIRFRATGSIVNRVVAVEVDFAKGGAVDPTSGAQLAIGDTLSVHDVQNMFPTIVPGSIGTAFYRPATAVDVPTPGDPATPNRWEIEECSESVAELTAELTDCLLKCSHITTVKIWNPESASGSFESASNCANAGSPRNHVKRSHYSASVLPPEIDFQGQPFINLSVHNPEQLDGIKESQVTIERTTDAHFADPGNQITPKAGSATSYRWIITAVKRRKARIIRGIWSSASPQVEDAFDGEDSSHCPVNGVQMPIQFDECPLQDGEPYWAVYDPENDIYKVISTMSAMLGTPAEIDALSKLGSDIEPETLLAFDGCDIDYPQLKHYGFPCPNETELITADAQLTAVTLSAAPAWDAVNLRMTSQTYVVYVCSSTAGAIEYIQFTDCSASSS